MKKGSRFPAICVSLMVSAAMGCGGGGTTSPASQDAPVAKQFTPIKTDAAVFWDRQTTESADLMQQLVAEFNGQGHEGPPLEVEYAGDYSEINRKVLVSVQAKKLPAMSVAYESMVTEYIRQGAVQNLSDYIADPAIGYSTEELSDFFEAVLETNRYAEYGGAMYSFPLSKSVLMMYFNLDVIREAGFDAPPTTWDEFLEQCRQIKAKTGKTGYAIDVDASTFNGMVFSMGGEVVENGRTLYDSAAAMRAMSLLETLVKEDLAYQIPEGSYDDRTAFSQDKVAFVLRSSSHQSYMTTIMGGGEGWGLSMLPQNDPEKPVTVLYGPNTCIFNVAEDQKQTAWAFIKYFNSPDVTARWALATGYLPSRKSASENAALKSYWDAWTYNRAAFDALGYARPEPNLPGWQEVRTEIERAVTSVVTGLKTADEAATTLKQKADSILELEE